MNKRSLELLSNKPGWLLVILLVLVLTGCGAPAKQSPAMTTPIDTLVATIQEQGLTPGPLSPTRPTGEATEIATPMSPPIIEMTQTAPVTNTAQIIEEPIPLFSGQQLPGDKNDLFAAAGACVVCHQQMVDEAQEDVSIDKAWRSTTHANAARDPYWLATVRSESIQFSSLQAVIEDKCAECHMPLARTSLAAQNKPAVILDQGLDDSANGMHSLAMDGVSCTLCHQIAEKNLGQAESYSGEYVIDLEAPVGHRTIYGPYQVDQAQATIMQSASGYQVVKGDYLVKPEFCATCHILYTPYVDEQGKVAGEFPEQMAYFEWQNSSVSSSLTCQGCHMPVANGAVKTSIVSQIPRSPFGQHTFVGGNTYMLRMLARNGDELQVTADGVHFQATLERTIQQLQNRTASLALQNVRSDGGKLTGEVVVNSQVGHKFPTGFPSRRVWLHLVVKDGQENIVFESGKFNADGSIIGNDNDKDAEQYEPHYTEINSSDQVQIYETILGNTAGRVTTTLLHGSKYLKDNRLLPAGFDIAKARPEIAVQGEAAKDSDFMGGKDVVWLNIDLQNTPSPWTISVELLYQSIGYRWAQNLGSHSADEIGRFLSYYKALPNLPVQVAETQFKVEK